MIKNIIYKFNIGDSVYYNLPDGDKGIITDVKYSLRYNQVEYEVCFGRASTDRVICYEIELSENKVF